MRYATFVERLRRSIVESTAASSPQLRGAVLSSELAEIPANLRPYVAKVRDHAHRINDADVVALKSSGYTEDQIFEITASAALGAALLRLDRALTVLEQGIE